LDLFPVFVAGGNLSMEYMPVTDNLLIAEFNAQRSEEAFAALLRQHVNLVYGTALRQVGNPGTAEDITQNVFVALAESAGKLGSHPTIAGWLHNTTLNKSREWLRKEMRRRRREEVAVNLQTARAEGESVWAALAPLLDEALLKLREADRQAVILYYMEGRNFQEVGSLIGVSEDAARKRVSRCLGELTAFFRRHGFAAPTLVPLFAASSHAAPPGLAARAAAAGVAAAHTAASASSLNLIKGAAKIMAWTKAKTTIVIGVSAVLAIGTTTMILKHQNQREHLPLPHPITTGETEFPKASWHFAGYANPESAFMSCMWAVDNGDSGTLLKSVSTSEQERLKRGNEIISDQDRSDYAKMMGYRIVDKQVASETNVILVVQVTGQDQTMRCMVERTAGEWKFAGNLRK
jgi:RNA polymerase sigma factor (sigma-70 family)